MKKRSLKNWLIRILAMVFVPMSILSILIQIYSIHLLRSNAHEQTERTLEMFAQSITSDIENMSLTLQTMFNYNLNVSQLVISDDEADLYFAGNELQLEMRKEILTHTLFDGIFIAVEREDGWIFLPGDAGKGTYCSGEIYQFIMEYNWEGDTSFCLVETFRGEPYLLYLIKSGSAYTGAWMRIGNIIDRFMVGENRTELTVYQESGELITGTEGITEKFWEDWQQASDRNNVVYQLDGKEYLANYCAVGSGLWLCMFTPESDIMENVIWVQRAITLFILFCLVSVPILLWQLRKRLIVPVQLMSREMDAVHLEKQFTLPDHSFLELEILEGSFNRMKEQIRQLKIEAYEQKLHEQEIHMQYLSSQIQPHFFLNSLNIIFSFAQIKRYDLIQEMALTLVRYFRYVFQKTSGHVCLREELEHVDDYLRIQELRYPGTFVYVKSVDESLLDIQILPFLIQTFMENSIKYVLNEETENEIHLDIHRLDNQHIRIQIWDTGSGFPEDVLRGVPDSMGESRYRIGIQNATQRMMIYYKKQAQIHLYNRPEGGACVELILPVTDGNGQPGR